VQEEAEAAAAAQSKSAAAAAPRQQRKGAADVGLPNAGAQTAQCGVSQAAGAVPHVDSSRQCPAQDLASGSEEPPAVPGSRQPAGSDSLAAAEADAAVPGPVQVDINVSECQEGGNQAAEAAAPIGTQAKVSITIQVRQR
jgi:hypothetical protein